MDNSNRYIAGVPCWIDTGRANPEPAMEFYGDLFNWQFLNQAPDDAPVRYMAAALDGMPVGAIGEQPQMDWAPVWNTYVQVADADDATSRVEAAGGKVTIPPTEAGAAGRWAACEDTAGASFCLWEPAALRGAAVVNGAGSWVFSVLETPDVEAAARFYGEVFGWKVSADGDGGPRMFMRPGYADHISAGPDPEFKDRLDQYGAPDGFGDAVAWVQPGESARWEITLGVDDADAAATRAAELGGEVIVAPFDTEWTRDAVLKDPEGVQFTISKFNPPT